MQTGIRRRASPRMKDAAADDAVDRVLL